MDYPKYVCHKEVSAVKVDHAERGADGALHVHLQDEFDTVILRGEPYRGKLLPLHGEYLVRYQDGYVSFSPAKAFEEGYTLVKPVEDQGESSEG